VRFIPVRLTWFAEGNRPGFFQSFADVNLFFVREILAVSGVSADSLLLRAI